MESEKKQTLAEMRKELRERRKESVKPVSRMRKGDIASELEKLRGTRDMTPPVASTPIAPVKKVKAAAESLKEAKISEYQTKPVEEIKKKSASMEKKSPKSSAKTAASGTKDKKAAKLAKILALMEDSSSEE